MKKIKFIVFLVSFILIMTCFVGPNTAQAQAFFFAGLMYDINVRDAYTTIYLDFGVMATLSNNNNCCIIDIFAFNIGIGYSVGGTLYLQGGISHTSFISTIIWLATKGILPWVSFGVEGFLISFENNTSFGLKLPIELKWLSPINGGLCFIISFNPVVKFNPSVWGFSISLGIKWFSGG